MNLQKPDSTVETDTQEKNFTRKVSLRCQTNSSQINGKNKSVDLSNQSSPKTINSNSVLTEVNTIQNTIKSLGFDSKLTKWIESIKNSSLLLNSSGHSIEELKMQKIKLYEMQADISDKYFTAFNNIPDQILSKFPGYDMHMNQQIKMLYQNLKARIRQTNRKLLNIVEIQPNNLEDKDTHKSTDITTKMSYNPSSDSAKIENNNEKLPENNFAGSSKCPTDWSLMNNRNINYDCKTRMFFFPKIPLENVEDPTLNSKKKSVFQLKKPITKSSTTPVADDTQKMLTGRNNENVGFLNNKIDSHNGNLPSSTVTSNTNVDKVSNISNIQHKIDDNEEIIKIDPKDFFTSWTNSDGHV